jgi:rare lipoprotein A (peptidoglycan hydrolase)
MKPIAPLAAMILLALATAARAGGWATVHRYVHPTGRCGFGQREVLSSIYGSESGPYTSSGERFIPSKITAASRIFPLRVWITATNPRNGRSVRVWVNDHGPYREAYAVGARMDFSTGAARALSMTEAAYICVSEGGPHEAQAR